MAFERFYERYREVCVYILELPILVSPDSFLDSTRVSQLTIWIVQSRTTPCHHFSFTSDSFTSSVLAQKDHHTEKERYSKLKRTVRELQGRAYSAFQGRTCTSGFLTQTVSIFLKSPTLLSPFDSLSFTNGLIFHLRTSNLISYQWPLLNESELTYCVGKENISTRRQKCVSLVLNLW